MLVNIRLAARNRQNIVSKLIVDRVDIAREYDLYQTM